jgi:hypothetical protein
MTKEPWNMCKYFELNIREMYVYENKPEGREEV